MANSDIFSGQCTSHSRDAGRYPRKELVGAGEYYCYQCEGTFDRPHKKKLYFGYDITVCIGECDKKWDERAGNHGFS